MVERLTDAHNVCLLNTCIMEEWLITLMSEVNGLGSRSHQRYWIGLTALELWICSQTQLWVKETNSGPSKNNGSWSASSGCSVSPPTAPFLRLVRAVLQVCTSSGVRRMDTESPPSNYGWMNLIRAANCTLCKLCKHMNTLDTMLKYLYFAESALKSTSPGNWISCA